MNSKRELQSIRRGLDNYNRESWEASLLSFIHLLRSSRRSVNAQLYFLYSVLVDVHPQYRPGNLSSDIFFIRFLMWMWSSTIIKCNLLLMIHTCRNSSSSFWYDTMFNLKTSIGYSYCIYMSGTLYKIYFFVQRFFCLRSCTREKQLTPAFENSDYYNNQKFV